MTGDREVLFEQVVAAERGSDPRGGVVSAPAFHDLEPAERAAAFEETLRQRALERAVDAAGLTGTVRAVMARLRHRG